MLKQSMQETRSGAHARDPQWQVLFGDQPRSLLVPSGDWLARHRSIEFFVDNPLRRLWAHALIEADRVWPGAPLLPSLPAPVALPLSRNESSTHAAFQLGTPGPYQKASMLIMGDDGTPLVLVKIALGHGADAMVESEARWLRELDRHPVLAGRVPRLLAHGATRDGRRYLMLSVAAGRGGTSGFTEAHAAFLRDLAGIRMQTQTFTESAACGFIVDTLARLRAKLTLPVNALLAESLGDCVARLRGWRGPFVLAHGDFAPWNLRQRGERIVVFDWEYAEEGAIPLRDVCHFLLMPRVLAACGGIEPVQMQAVLDEVCVIAPEIHPGVAWERSTVAALLLGCLLHTALFYFLSRGGVARDDAVTAAYCRLLRERAQWID